MPSFQEHVLLFWVSGCGLLMRHQLVLLAQWLTASCSLDSPSCVWLWLAVHQQQCAPEACAGQCALSPPATAAGLPIVRSLSDVHRAAVAACQGACPPLSPLIHSQGLRHKCRPCCGACPSLSDLTHATGFKSRRIGSLLWACPSVSAHTILVSVLCCCDGLSWRVPCHACRVHAG